MCPRLLGHAALGEPQAQVAFARRRQPLGSRVTGGAVPAATIRSMVRPDTPSSSASCGDSQATDKRRLQILVGVVLLAISLGGLALLLVLFA